MITSTQNESGHNTGVIDAERSLRLIATLPAPEGIEDRVKAGLRAAPSRALIFEWPIDGRRWMHGPAMRTVAAAAIVLVVAGGGWGVYSHIQVASSPTAAVTPQGSTGNGGFSAAGAKRMPQTLERPVVANPVTIKQKSDRESSTAVSRKQVKHRSTKEKTLPLPVVH